MKQQLRGLAVRLAIVAAMLVAHQVLAMKVAANDPLVALIVEHSVWTGVLAASLLLLRVWLVLVVPGWLLARLIVMLWAQRVSRSDVT